MAEADPHRISRLFPLPGKKIADPPCLCCTLVFMKWSCTCDESDPELYFHSEAGQHLSGERVDGVLHHEIWAGLRGLGIRAMRSRIRRNWSVRVPRDAWGSRANRRALEFFNAETDRLVCRIKLSRSLPEDLERALRGVFEPREWPEDPFEDAFSGVRGTMIATAEPQPRGVRDGTTES
jgi:hypothetical protein